MHVRCRNPERPKLVVPHSSTFEIDCKYPGAYIISSTKLEGKNKPERIYVGQTGKSIVNRLTTHCKDLLAGKHHSWEMQEYLDTNGWDSLEVMVCWPITDKSLNTKEYRLSIEYSFIYYCTLHRLFNSVVAKPRHWNELRPKSIGNWVGKEVFLSEIGELDKMSLRAFYNKYVDFRVLP